MSYTKHNYKKGDELLASQLNEMDDQIALNEQTADTLVTVSNTQPSQEKNRVWVKATPSEIEIPTMEDFKDITKIPTETEYKTNLLFTGEEIAVNKYYDGQTPSKSPNGIYYDTVLFIPVVAGTTYRILNSSKISSDNMRFIVFFDNSKNYIRTETYKSTFSPDQDGYVHISLNVEPRYDNAFKLYVDGTSQSIINSMVPFRGRILAKDLHLEDSAFKSEFSSAFKSEFSSAFKSELEISKVKYKNLDGVIAKNIAPDDLTIPGYYNEDETITKSNDYYSSPSFLQVKPSTTYYTPAAAESWYGTIIRKMIEYDADKNIVKFHTNEIHGSFTTQENTAYIRVSLYVNRGPFCICEDQNQSYDAYPSSTYLIPAEKIETTPKSIEQTDMNFGIIHKSSNLYSGKHPLLHGWAYGNNWESTDKYYFTDYVELPANKKIITNIRYRGLCLYNRISENEYTYTPTAGEPVADPKSYITYNNTDTLAGTIRDYSQYQNAKYVRFWMYPADEAAVNSSFYVGDAENYDETMTEKYFDPFWVPAEQIALKSDIKDQSQGSLNEEITVANSDRIGLIGDSYSESHYTVRGKAYINKLSLFSDYLFENYAASGDIYYGQIDKIRNQVSKYGTTFEESRPKYVMMNCFTNDIKTLSIDQYGNALRRACEQVIGEGAQPIICTEYHSLYSNETQVISLNHQIAREYGCPCWDISPIVSLIRGTDYAAFWGGSHPGTRPNSIESDNYEKFLAGLERPRKSLKIFRCRDSHINDSIDDLIFWTNEERAEKFREIYCGHTYITNPTEVDNCTASTQTSEISEYAKLIRKDSISMPTKSLVSCVIPGDIRTTKKAALKLSVNGDVTVYVKSINAGSYVRPARLLRFDYSNDFATAPEVGATYTDPTIMNNGNLVTMTVVSILPGQGDGNAKGIIYMSGSFGNNNYNNLSGTLTKVSGTGDASIAYSYKAIGYRDLSDITLGGWTELLYDSENENYPIPNDELKYAVQRDKIDFLLVANSEYNLSDAYVEWEGIPSKVYTRKDIKVLSNYDNPSEELIAHPTFGTAGTVDPNWNVTPISVADDCYPYLTSSAYVVNEENVLVTSIPANSIRADRLGWKGTYILEVWARYFPPLYTDGTGEQITIDSYDYATLKVAISKSNDFTENDIVTLKDRVNLHWKMVQIPIEMAGFGGKDMYIRLSSNKDLQIAYVSLKEKV